MPFLTIYTTLTLLEIAATWLRMRTQRTAAGDNNIIVAVETKPTEMVTRARLAVVVVNGINMAMELILINIASVMQLVVAVAAAVV